MSRGYLIFAQNSNVNYLQQAIALSMSLKINGNKDPVSVVTNDLVPKEYQHLFDRIIPVPWGDSSKHSDWKVENRWKLYHVSPYEHTIVLDSDILVTTSLDNAWNFLVDNDYNLFFTSKVFDFKSRKIIDQIYRKTFIENSLPNVYFGFHYFKKSTQSKEFYQLLEDIVKNYQLYYAAYTPNKTQEFVSLDVSSAIAVKILQIENQVTCSVVQPAKFIHMKPAIQGLSINFDKWSTVLAVDYDDVLTVGNYPQRGIFHYVEDDFLSKDLFNKLCRQLASLEQ